MATKLEFVSLSFTDLTGSKTNCVVKGSNKWWTGWLEQDANGSTYSFRCLWGSVGAAGNDKGSVSGLSQSAAMSQLSAKKAEKIKKGYTLLQVRDQAEEISKAAAKGIVPTVAPAVVAGPTAVQTIQPEVSRLLATLYGSTASVVRAGLSSSAQSSAANPIGNLSDRQLDIGGEILQELQQMIAAQFGPETPANKAQTIPVTNTLAEMTSKYLSNVPRELGMDMRGRENLHRVVLSSYERIEAQAAFLETLRGAALAKESFHAAAVATTATGKEQAWYAGLNSELDYCAPGSADYKKVADIFNNNQSRKNSNWWRNGQCTLKLANVFRFTRNGSEVAFDRYAETVLRKPQAAGRLYSWHGTRTENIVSISKKGLLMPENLPPGPVRAGFAFGRGLYHAPCVQSMPKIQGTSTDNTNGLLKAANYSSVQGAYYNSSASGTSGFLFLEEVVLGRGEIRTSSCNNQHRPDRFPENDFIYAAAGGCSSLTHDELVTFSQDAQVFRYMVEARLA